MQVLDQIFAWAIIALGAVRCVTAFRVLPLSSVTLSLSATAVAIILGGFLNVARARNKDGITRAFSLIANFLILALAVALAWPVRYQLLQNWQILALLGAIIVECLFAFRG